MILMQNWAHALADALNDPLLPAETILDLKRRGLTRIIREDQDLLAFVTLLPLPDPREAVLTGLWVTHYDDLTEHMETATQVIRHALDIAITHSITVVIPNVLLMYVDRPVLTVKEAGRTMDQLMRAMHRVCVPAKHPLRHGGLKVIPAPGDRRSMRLDHEHVAYGATCF